MESHPDNALDDLRLDNPFPELREHVRSYNLDQMEKRVCLSYGLLSNRLASFGGKAQVYSRMKYFCTVLFFCILFYCNIVFSVILRKVGENLSKLRSAWFVWKIYWTCKGSEQSDSLSQNCFLYVARKLPYPEVCSQQWHFSAELNFCSNTEVLFCVWNILKCFDMSYMLTFNFAFTGPQPYPMDCDCIQIFRKMVWRGTLLLWCTLVGL